MSLIIEDPTTESFMRELAALTGETVTTAVRQAAEERLQRVRGRSLAAEILAIGKRCTADKILGYDEHGLPYQSSAACPTRTG